MSVFIGKNILYIAHSLDETASAFAKTPEEIRGLLEDARKKLSAVRGKRPRPHLDDKVITGWNGLMISAFARGYQVLDEPRYLEAARSAAQFIMSKLYNKESQTLFRRYRDGESRFEGTLQDYAFLVTGLLDLYEASFDIHWLEDAIVLTKKQNEIFWDPRDGGFFDISGHDKSILIRTKEDYDGAEPTGNSVAALNLFRLSQITDNKGWRTMAEKTITVFGEHLKQLPEGLPQMLVALDWNRSTPAEIIIAGKPAGADTKELLKVIHSHFKPDKIILLLDTGDGQKKLQSILPFVKEMRMIDHKATAYVCENYACQLPTSEGAMLAQLLTTKAIRHK